MSQIIQVSDNPFALSHDELSEFKKDIHAGFTRANKQIPSKYFYDGVGSELFNQITRHPDYYLTQAEIEIINTHKRAISALMSDHAFNLVELGPGEGIKTELLITQFLQDSRQFTYIPIDISVKYLKHLHKHFKNKIPDLSMSLLHADFIHGLEWLHANSQRPNLVLFLGSSIGNYDHLMAKEFLRHIWSVLNDGDYLLLGIDLIKDINVLLRAYNDSDNLTRHFNLNLLARINQELKADFDLRQFHHYPTYNVYTGAMESYLISLKQQAINIQALEDVYHFDMIESIHVEYSFKYSLGQIETLLANSGFGVVEMLMDSKRYFCDVICQVKK